MKKNLVGIYLLALAGTAAMAAEVKPIPWSDKITIKGDLRIREEYISQGDDSKGKGGFSENRLRLRARIAAEARINNELKAVIGLSSGNDDPVSSNQTLGQEFSRKAIRLELAYMEWTPSIVSDLGAGAVTLDGGKMKNPFIMVSELIWDPDVNPEGLAASYKMPDTEYLEAMANGGAMWYYERKSDPDTMLYTGQVGLKFKPKKDYYILVAGSLYYFTNVRGNHAFDYNNEDKPTGASFYGNSSENNGGNNTNMVYAYEYHEVEGMAAIGFPLPLPAVLTNGKIYGDYVKNLDPDSNNAGYQFGLQLGELRDKGDIMVGYAYRKLEKDATMGAMTDSDWWGGGTDGKGNQVKAGYQIFKNWSLNATYFFKNKKEMSKADVDYDRFQLDLTAKF